jgi:hypothetical protein
MIDRVKSEVTPQKSIILLWLGFVGLTTLSGCDDVRSADQAVAVAERACAGVIKPGHRQIKWQVAPGTSKSGLGDGWQVQGVYDASEPGLLSLITLDVFVPKNGNSSECLSITN